MISLAQTRTLGGIGSILILLSAIPQGGAILGIVGFILVLIAVKYISDDLADRSIFHNMLVSVILAIAGIIIGAVFIITSLFTSFGASMYGQPFNPSMFAGPRMAGFLAMFFIALVVIWIFYIVSAIYLRRSYRAIAQELKINMFNTVALLYLIGAVLSIVLVGFFIIYIAEILQVVAFFSIPEQAPQVSGTQPV